MLISFQLILTQVVLETQFESSQCISVAQSEPALSTLKTDVSEENSAGEKKKFT
jgi:hypothetical protein